MNQMTAPLRQLPKWLSPAFFLFILYAIFFLPFWEPLLLAFLFSSASAPLINYLLHKFHGGRKMTSALLMGGIILAILLLLILGGIRLYSLIYDQVQDPNGLLSKFDSVQSVRAQLVKWLQHLPLVGNTNMESQLDQALASTGDRIRGLATTAAKMFVVKTPEILLNIFIFLAALGVFIFWGPKKWKFISRFTAQERAEDMRSFAQFEKICAISIGSIFLTGLIQSSIVAVGASIAGYPFFLSFLFAFILSLIPVLGAASVPTFLALLSYANGSTSGALILIVTTLIAGSSDNIVRAWLFSRAANSNPVISLLALLGGITLFGFTGLFLAPVVEQLVMSYLQKNNHQEKAVAVGSQRPVSETSAYREFQQSSQPQPQS